MLDIRSELTRHQALKERILAEWPDVAEEDLRDSIEGATNLDQSLLAVARAARAEEAMIEALENRMNDLKERANRRQRRVDKAREIMADAMAQAGMKKVEAEDVTLSLKPTPPKVIITSEAELPSDYFIVTAKPDKKTIKRDLERDLPVPGAMLSNGGMTVQLRFK